MQALTTKFIPATDHHGSRIKVRAQVGTITVPWDHAKDVPENHDAAALTFLKKWGWPGHWVRGSLPDDTGYAYVKAESGISEIPARISKRF